MIDDPIRRLHNRRKKEGARIDAVLHERDADRIAALEAQLRERDEQIAALSDDYARAVETVASLEDELEDKDEQIAKAREALLIALPYVEDALPVYEYALSDETAKANIVCRHVAQIRAALATIPDAETVETNAEGMGVLRLSSGITLVAEPPARTGAGEEWTPDGLHRPTIEACSVLAQTDADARYDEGSEPLWSFANRLRALAGPQEKP